MVFQKFIYADYHATTPVDPRVADKVLRVMLHDVGNASSSDHVAGDRAEALVDEARRHVAALVDADPQDVIFTSGATESLNLAIQGFVRHLERSRPSRLPHVAVSTVEHRAVLETVESLQKEKRIRLSYLPVDCGGRVNLKSTATTVENGVDLVVVMAANNEVGTINPVDDVGSIAAAAGAAFLCDATQAVGRVSISTRTGRITFLALSAHKIYGPQGVGALVISPGARLEPLLHGGGQQRGLRPGTLNVPGIVGLGEAARLRHIEAPEDEARVRELRDHLQRQLRSAVAGLTVNGHEHNRLAGNLHISISGVPSGLMVAQLRDRIGIATGAACTSGLEQPSHVLRAMGLPAEQQETALRIGLGKFTTDDEVEIIGAAIIEAITSVRKLLAD